MRTIIIAGIVAVFLCVGYFIYTQYDIQNFEKSLPKPPRQDATEKSSVPISENSVTNTEHIPIVEDDFDTEHITKDKKATTATSQNGLIPDESLTHQRDREEATDVVDEYSPAEIRAVFKKAFNFPVSDINETYTQLSDILRSRFGDDPDISNFLGTWKSMNKVMALASIAEFEGNRQEDIDAFLSHLPAVIMDDLVDITIRLVNPSKSEVAKLRELADSFRSEIDNIAIASEARPFVEEAVRSGELTPDEGAAFIREISGLEVKAVPKRTLD